MKKTLLGLAIAMAAATQANAMVTNGDTAGVNNANGGELVLWVYDASTQMTYGRDLGLDWVSFNANSNYSFSASDLLKATFGQTLSSELQWQVIAADSTAVGLKPADGGAYTNQYWGTRVMFTSIDSSVGKSMTNAMVTNAASNANVLTQSANTISGWANNTNGEITWNEGQTWDWNYNLSGTMKANSAFYSASNPGLSMYFVLGTQNQRAGLTTRWAADASTAGNVSDLPGMWTLGTDGTLTYAVASQPTPEVPVPAAAWLFGSALAGMVGIRRRQK